MLAPPKRTKLSHQLFDALVSYVVNQGLVAGDPLPSTAELCAQFKTSRPVVREALSALEAVGLVEIASGKNAVVRDLDGHLITIFLARAVRGQSRPLAALMEVRAPLEIQCARLAADRADSAAVERVSALLAAMDDALHDAERYPPLDVAFHMEIARTTGNKALAWVSEAIRGELMEVMVQVRSYRERHGLVGNEQEQHAAIVAAIRRGDGEAAAAAMAQHMETSTVLVCSLEPSDDDASAIPSQGSAPRLAATVTAP